MTRKPTQPATPANDSDSVESHHSCAAEGCPLPGTWTSATNGEGPWFCFLHTSTKASKRDEVTRKIHENTWIYRMYERVMQTEPSSWVNVKQLATQFCARRNENDLAPKTDERRSEYERRLRIELEKRCRPAKQVDAFEQEAAAVARETTGLLSDFLPKAA